MVVTSVNIALVAIASYPGTVIKHHIHYETKNTYVHVHVQTSTLLPSERYK